MTGFREHAAKAGSSDVVRASDLGEEPPRRLAIDSWENGLLEADEVSEEGEFPQYGTFLPVVRADDPEGEEVLWEFPSGLALWIEEEIGQAGGYEEVVPSAVVVDVDFAAKSASGEWRFSGRVSVTGDENAP